MASGRCPACQADLDPDAIFCNECGLAQAKSLKSQISEPDVHRVGAIPPRRLGIESSTKCIACGTSAPFGSPICLVCAESTGRRKNESGATSTKPEPSASEWIEDGPFPSSLIAATRKRYKEGYLYARAIVGAGVAVQIFGVIVGVVLLLIGLGAGAAVADSSRRGPFGDPMIASVSGAVMGAIPIGLGIIIGVLLFVIGILIKAAGQFLKAQLDSAVCASPFLSNLDRAQMMSLPTNGSVSSSSGRSVNTGSDWDVRSSAPEVDGGGGNGRIIAAYAGGSLSLLLFPISLLIYIPVVAWALTSTASSDTRFHVVQSVVFNGALIALSLLSWISAYLTGNAALAVGAALILIVSSLGNIVLLVLTLNKPDTAFPILGDVASNWVTKPQSLTAV